MYVHPIFDDTTRGRSTRASGINKAQLDSTKETLALARRVEDDLTSEDRIARGNGEVGLEEEIRCLAVSGAGFLRSFGGVEG